MKRVNLLTLLYSLAFLLLPLVHVGKEYIYVKFLLWSGLFILIIILTPGIPVPDRKGRILLLVPLVMLLSIILFTGKFHLFWGIHSSMSLIMAFLFGLYLWNFSDENPRRTSFFFIAMLVAIVIVVTVGFLQYLHYLPIPLDRYGKPDPGSLLGLSNFTSHYLVISLPFTLYVAWKQQADNRIKWLATLLTLLFVIAYISIAGNRASLIAIIGMGTLWILLTMRKQIKSIIAITGGLFAILLITGWWKNLYHTLTSVFNLRDPAIQYRLHLWKSTTEAILHNPAGFGMGEFRFKIWQYIDPYLQRMVNRGAIVIQHAHNEYLEYSVEGSILLLILFISIPLVLGARKRRGFEKYSLLSTGIISLFSFPLHMPVSLFHSGIGYGAAISRKHISWKPSPTIKMILLSMFVVYTLILSVVTVAEFHSRRGISYIIKEKYDLAEKEFTLAISYFPYEPNYFYNRAVCRENLGLTNGAIRDLKQVIKLSPYQPQAYKMLGVLYLKEGDRKSGIHYLEEFLRITGTPTEMEPLHFIIAASLDIGDITTARKYMNIALEKYGEDRIIQMDYLALLIAERKYDEALKILHHIEERYSDLPPEFYLLKIQLYKDLGKSPLQPMKMLILRRPDPKLIIDYLRELKKEKGEREAYGELTEILKKYPSLLNYILSDPALRMIFEGGRNVK